MTISSTHSTRYIQYFLIVQVIISMIVKQFSLRRCFSVALSYHQTGDKVTSKMRIILLKLLKFEWFLKVSSLTLIVSVRACPEGDRVCLFEWVFFITSLCWKIYAVQIVHGIKINSDQLFKIREGFPKKVAVLLDFVQITSTPPPNFDNLYHFF